MKIDRKPSRRTFLQWVTHFAAAMPSFAYGAAASSEKPRIGFLSGDFADLNDSFFDELHSLGFIDGQSISVERRLAGAGSDPRAMAEELAGMRLAFIVVGALPFALLIRKANPNMPMVIANCPGMVSNGFARSLAHPGGIYTGMDELPPGLTSKRLSLLKTAVPTAKRIGLLSTTPGVGGHETQLEDAKRAARRLGIVVKPYRAATTSEVDDALTEMIADGVDGMLNFQGGLSIGYRQKIVDFAAEHRLPAIYQATMFADAGGLMAWAPDLPNQFREAARLAGRILQGAKPGDLPIRHPARYFLTINARTAKQLGLVLPPALKAQATRIIE